MYMQHPDTYAAARWANPQDIAARHCYNPATDFFLGRNPYNFNDAIGVRDDTHVFLCAGTRGDKGRSVVIGNLLQWRGSIVSIDPKGENASIAAERRAAGNDFCEGLGQATFVLDPYRRAKVPDELRASCNLMDFLDANSGSLLSEAESLAEAMRAPQEGGESESWSKDAAQITALVIAHVKTFKFIKGSHRNLVTVREMLLEGQQSIVEWVKEQNRAEVEAADAEDREPDLKPIPDPYEWLFKDMEQNDAQGGAIARRARGLVNLMRSNVRQWGSLIQNARTETNFIDDLQMVEQLDGSSGNGRSLKISDLQQDPKGISVFICLPDNPSHPAIRWQKAILTMILDHMGEEQGLPATGQQVLMVLDEFASMGKMPMILNGMGSIAGAGIKLFVIVTQIGDLKQLYDKAWQKIPANCGTQMWFMIRDSETAEFIEKDFGEAQIVLMQRTESAGLNVGSSSTKSTATGRAETETVSQGQSEGTSLTSSTARTTGHSMSISESDSDTWQNSEGTGQSSSRGSNSSWQVSDTIGSGTNRGSSRNKQFSVGRNGFFDPFVRSTNDARGSSSSSGTSTNTSQSSSHGGGYNQSNTISQNSSQSVGGSHGTTRQQGNSQSNTQSQASGTSSTLSKTYAEGVSRNRTTTLAEGTSYGANIGLSLAENIQKRPLISMAEVRRFLGKVTQRDHPAYPGFALVRIDNEEPMLVRKCYYDQDPLFERRFTPHYAHAKNYLPFSQQRLVGGQYTSAHFLPIRLPEIVRTTAARVDVDLNVTVDQWFEKDENILEWTGATWNANANQVQKAATTKIEYQRPEPSYNVSAAEPLKVKRHSVEDFAGEPIREAVEIRAPHTGMVVDVAENPAFTEDGDIVLLRLEREVSDDERKQLEIEYFSQIIQYLRQRGASQREIDAMTSSLNVGSKLDWEHDRKKAWERSEANRIARERADAERIAREQAEKERLEREAAEAADARLAANIAAAQEERFKYVRYYRNAFLTFVFFLPSFLFFTETANLIIEPSAFKPETQYENRRYTDWNGYIRSNCISGASNIDEHWWGRYTYTCTANVGKDYPKYRNAPRLVFGTFFYLGIMLAVVLFLMGKIFPNWMAQEEHSDYLYGSDNDQEIMRTEGWGQSLAWLSEKFGGWLFLIGLMLLICLGMYQVGMSQIIR